MEWTLENPGESGFGDVGAVIGATYPEELARLRQLLPEVFFLVPGFGAQGGTARDIAGEFRQDGLGALINSSRGILYPYAPEDPNWEICIKNATNQTITQLRDAYNL